jgi:hypothetical protein
MNRGPLNGLALRCEREFDSLVPLQNFKKAAGQPAVLIEQVIFLTLLTGFHC